MDGERQFGRYRTTARLGAGAMGDVFLAVDDVLGREVAVKTLRAAGVSLVPLDERFRNEARAIASLSHPNIVQVFDLDLAADPPYLVLERVAGPSLDKRLERGALPVGDVVALGVQLARALAAAHQAQIVHRDVKPANVLAAGDGTWKLADFGVAHVPDSSLTITGQFVGSPAYAAPEALLRGEAGPAQDVYGLGATLYEAAAGGWPRVVSREALFAPVPPLASVAPGLPADVARAIDRAIADDPASRPTAAALADLIARGASVASPPPPATSQPRFPIYPFAAGAAAVLGLVAIVAIARCSGGDTARSEAATVARPPATEPASTEPAAATDDPGRTDHEWNKIIEELDRGHAKGARKKLDDWERRFGGSTPESEELRRQIDATPEKHGHGKGKGKKHERDDD